MMSRFHHHCLLLLFFLALFPAAPQFAQESAAPDPAEETAPPDLTAAAASAKADMQGALDRLAQQREKIAAEKPELSGEFAEVEKELLAKRRQADLVRMTQADRAASLADLQRKRMLLQQDLSYTTGLVGDLPEQMRTRAASVEQERIAKNFPKPLPDGKPLNERLARQAELLAASLDRLETLLGGQVIETQAVTAKGEEVAGKAALLGPVAIFANGSAGGQLHDSADLIPHLSTHGDFQPARTIVQGSEAAISLDLTGGAAQALSELSSEPLDLVRNGGFWVYPILLMALISAVCGLLKLINISAIRLPHDGWVAEILGAIRGGDHDEAIRIANQPQHPAGELFVKALDAVDAGAEVVEEVIYESMIGVQARLQKWLPFIAVTAATAPLLGLLGTVSGMIRTFNVIQIFGSGDPKPLAGGISEALITTLFGLVVAIPSLILHAMLSRRCQGILQSTEQLGLTLVNGLRRGEHTRSK